MASDFGRLYGFGSMSISCTPHFKSDAVSPWVTRESVTSLHYWFNPQKEQTLLEVAEHIEKWIRYDYLSLEPWNVGFYYNYNMEILCMEIRGVKYDREVLAGITTSENFHNEEPFTLRYKSWHGSSDRGRSNNSGRCAIL